MRQEKGIKDCNKRNETVFIHTIVYVENPKELQTIKQQLKATGFSKQLQ